MVAARFLANPPSYLGVLTLLTGGCRNVPTSGAFGELDRGVERTETALPPPEAVAAPSASALLYVSEVARTTTQMDSARDAGAGRTVFATAPAATRDAGSGDDVADERVPVEPADEAENAMDPMRLDVTVAELDAPSCAVGVDGDFSLEAEDLAVYLLAPDGKNPRSLEPGKPEACTAANATHAGLTPAEAGWFLVAHDEGTFLEFCPDGCAQLKRQGGRLLIDVRWGVRFYAR